MMDGSGGRVLVDVAIHEVIHFRKRVLAVGRELAHDTRGGDPWFFGVWQPDDVRDPNTGLTSSFSDTPNAVLENEPSCWTLEPHKAWHGFGDLGENYCLLDPTKVTLTTPGVDVVGTLAETGIPAPVLSSYLDTHRIEVEKTGDYSVLVLFSIGTTNGKWGSLLEGLLSFKRAYDAGQSLNDAMPDLVAPFPDRYDGVTLRGTIELLDRAFNETPTPYLKPGFAYRRLVRGPHLGSHSSVSGPYASGRLVVRNGNNVSQSLRWSKSRSATSTAGSSRGACTRIRPYGSEINELP